jgi:hypothetical protein
MHGGNPEDTSGEDYGFTARIFHEDVVSTPGRFDAVELAPQGDVRCREAVDWAVNLH